MAEHTGIEWCDSTWNPWIGCTKVGPGCDHCYAEELMAKRWQRVRWGSGQPRQRTSASNWAAPLHWEKTHGDFTWHHDRRRRVFCSSLADVFDNEVPKQWREDLFALIRQTPHLDWLLLTKRIGNAAVMIREAIQNFDIGYDPAFAAWPWPNVWLGATVVNQEEAERDVPKLLATPAAVRFLSIEPMLGPVNLYRFMVGDGHDAPHFREPLHWVICGGESGHKARPIQVDWVRNLRDQCEAAQVPFLFKQWGEWLPPGQDGDHDADPLKLNASDVHMRIGKRAAGNWVDGRQHLEFPQATA